MKKMKVQDSQSALVVTAGATGTYYTESIMDNIKASIEHRRAT